MEILFSILLGVGLAASCGFKAFVPFLIMSIANLSGHLELSEGFAWIGTYPALVVFVLATVLEILAYYIPVVDNALDIISTPVTIICGVLVTVSCIQGLSPLFSWTIAVILGGTAAGVTKTINTSVRAVSTATTVGLGNMVVNTFQTFMSIIMSINSIFMPITVIIMLAIIIYTARKFKHILRRRKVDIVK